MSATDDADVQATMQQVRGSWPAWFLLALTIGIAGWGGLQLRERAEKAEAFAEDSDTKLAARFAKIAVAEEANVELKQRVTRLAAENAELVPLREAKLEEARVLDQKATIVAELSKQIVERMQKEHDAKQLRMKPEGGTLEVTIEEGLLFADATAALSPPGAEALVVLGAVIATVPLERIDVVGHSAPTDEGPWPLSGARAGAVASVLVDKARLDAAVVHIAAHGPSKPRSTGRSRSAASRNRRIELLITPALPPPEATPAP